MTKNEINLLGQVLDVRYTEIYKCLGTDGICACLNSSCGGGRVHFVLVRKNKCRTMKLTN